MFPNLRSFFPYVSHSKSFFHHVSTFFPFKVRFLGEFLHDKHPLTRTRWLASSRPSISGRRATSTGCGAATRSWAKAHGGRAWGYLENLCGVRLLWMYVCMHAMHAWMYVCMHAMYVFICIYPILSSSEAVLVCIDPLLDHTLAGFLKFGLAEECAPSSCRMDMFRKIVFNLEQTHRNRMAQYPTWMLHSSAFPTPCRLWSNLHHLRVRMDVKAQGVMADKSIQFCSVEFCKQKRFRESEWGSTGKLLNSQVTNTFHIILFRISDLNQSTPYFQWLPLGGSSLMAVGSVAPYTSCIDFKLPSGVIMCHQTWFAGESPIIPYLYKCPR